MSIEISIGIPTPIGSINFLTIPINAHKLFFQSKDLKEYLIKISSLQEVGKVFEHSLNKIFLDQYIKGNGRGGWGKAYKDRYFLELFGDSLPSDSVVHPHSISLSLWVLEGLKAAFEAENGFIDFKKFSGQQVSKIFNEIACYYRRHFDEKTGGVGPTWTGPDSTEQRASNVRHASSGLFAFLLLPGFLQETQKTSRYIIDSLRNENSFKNMRALSISSILRALFTIKENTILKHGLFQDKFQLNNIISIGEMELLSKFDSKRGIWDSDQPGSEKAKIWYSVFILRSIPKIQTSTNVAIKELYRECLNTLIGDLLFEDELGIGLPYIPGKSQDIGMTATLLNILENDVLLDAKKKKKLIKAFIKFILKNHDNPHVNKYTYSWTWSMILLSFCQSKISMPRN